MFRSIWRSGVHIVLCLGVDRALECNLKLSSKITAKENRASDYNRNLFLIEIIFLNLLLKKTHFSGKLKMTNLQKHKNIL